MLTHLLNGPWQLYQANPGESFSAFLEETSENTGIPVNVPGDVNAALVAVKKMPNPHYDTDARECYWVTGKEWWYKKDFLYQGDADRARLFLESVDGTSEIWLNGKLLGKMQNAFRRHCFEVGGILKKGENQLVVRFYAIDSLIGSRVDELAGWKEKRTYLRKPQYNFGWDWALPLPSLGLAGSVGIESDCAYEITDYSIQTHRDGRLDFAFEVSEDAKKSGYEILITIDGYGEHQTRKISCTTYCSYASLTLENPRLWYPLGYGEPALYEYKIVLLVGQDSVQTLSGKLGIREIKLLEEPFTPEAGPGYSFWILVNGIRVFCKGGNWIPMELWPGCICEDDYNYYLNKTVEANFNIQRIWGGGIYEHNRFYELCDELGIMVWQDFMFASSEYPVKQLWDEICLETDYQIRRLRNHPSVILWCGCNEDAHSWSYYTHRLSLEPPKEAESDSPEGKNMKMQQDSGTYDGNFGKNRPYMDCQLYSMVLRGMVGRFGLDVPYIESSPQSRDDYGNMPNSGNCHISCWKYALFETDGVYENWRSHFDKVCSFDSEFCIQGPCSEKLTRSFLRDENQWPPNEAWIYHIQRGHQMLPHYQQTMWIAGNTFGSIHCLQDYVKYGQALHSEMMRAEFDNARANYPNEGGTMMWMFNDCWPTSNWSIIDYTKNPKPSYYAAKRACTPVSPIIVAPKGTLRFLISNQTASCIAGTACWGMEQFDGKTLWKKSAEFSAAAGDNAKLDQIDLPRSLCDNSYYFLDASIGGVSLERIIYFPYGWKMLKLPIPQFTIAYSEPEQVGNVWKLRIEIKAQSFLRFFHILYRDEKNRPDFSDNYFDMTKGEKKSLFACFSKKPDPSLLVPGDWFTQWE